jgi:hypothetical protein
VKEKLMDFLKMRKKRTVSLSELEQLASGTLDYYSFASCVMQLEAEGIIEKVKSHGENGKNPSLSYTYRVNKSLLKQDLQEKIKEARLIVHPSIYLEGYFHLPEEQWKQDYPMIVKINEYLKKHSFPAEQVPAPERSFEMVGDEKWITEGGGKELLERIRIWKLLKIVPVSDPLMFAVNPLMIQNTSHKHLIVENKTTYQGLLPTLTETSFTTLIYGSGKKIIKSIEQFDYQLPLQSCQHHFYYFGDLDHEGINIWYLLSKKIQVLPAIPFYEACLSQPYVFGKQNQRKNDEAMNEFLSYFPKVQQAQITSMLQNGGYYPQEIIKTNELQHIWRNASWK